MRLVQGLKAKGLRVDGIGEQGHWGIDDPPLAAIDAALAAIRASGTKPLVTELDMDVLPRDPDMWGADLVEEGEDPRGDERVPGRPAPPPCRSSSRAATRTCSRFPEARRRRA